MSNHIIVMTEDRKKLGEMFISLACFEIVNQIAEKYTGEMLPIFGDVNAALERVYRRCTPEEEIQLLIFINDKTTFDQSHKPALESAISNWPWRDDGPKKHLELILQLLESNDKVLAEYSGVSTTAITVTVTN